MDPRGTRTEVLGRTAGTAATAAKPGHGFIDTLGLFLRTVPIYPDGHGRVTAVAERLEAVLARTEGSLVLDVTPRGLVLDGVAVESSAGHARAVRAVLDATAIARVTFQKGAPLASFTHFARALGRNARLAANGSLTFLDLWCAPIAGICVEEQVYDADAFGAGVDAQDAPRLAGAHDLPASEGAAADSDSAAEASAGDGGAAAAGLVAPVRARMDATIASDLRDCLRDEPEIGALLSRLETDLLARDSTARAGGRVDLLEQILRILPIEARLDPAKGIRVVHQILERLSSDLAEEEEGTGAEGPSSTELLMKTLRQVFPTRSRDESDLPLPEAEAPLALTLVEPSGDPDAEFELLERISLPLVETVHRADEVARAFAAIPTLDAESGIRHTSGLLIHTLLAETEPERREASRRRLVAHLKAQRPGGTGACIESHLREATMRTGGPDVETFRLLASVIDDAGLPLSKAALDWIAPTHLATVFPRLLPARLAAGGTAGAVCRALGRVGVLAAAKDLLAEGGALTGPSLERVLAEGSTDVLPLFEVVLLGGAAGAASRVAHALRSLAIPCVGAVALRVLPEDRVPLDLLRTLCEDGFLGHDSHRGDARAVTAIRGFVAGRERSRDDAARAYATAALGTFDRALVEDALEHLVRRRWLLPVEPAAVRRSAKSILDGYVAKDDEAIAAEAAAGSAPALPPVSEESSG